MTESAEPVKKSPASGHGRTTRTTRNSRNTKTSKPAEDKRPSVKSASSNEGQDHGTEGNKKAPVGRKKPTTVGRRTAPKKNADGKPQATDNVAAATTTTNRFLSLMAGWLFRKMNYSGLTW